MTTIWTTWNKKFAYWPTKLVLYETVSFNGFSFRHYTGVKWIWLKEYWHRKRRAIYLQSGNTPVYEHDYAFDLFDFIRKPD